MLNRTEGSGDFTSIILFNHDNERFIYSHIIRRYHARLMLCYGLVGFYSTSDFQFIAIRSMTFELVPLCCKVEFTIYLLRPTF